LTALIIRQGTGIVKGEGSWVLKLKICLAVILLVCILGGMGWFASRWNLAAAQVGDRLKSGNGQYYSPLDEVSRLAKMSNEQLVLSNQKVAQANASIEELKQELDDAEKFGAYWWERAHPKEFASLSELKAWLDKDDTDTAFYIFGTGCLEYYDCDDYATALVYNALADGYSVSLQIEGSHMLNSTIIGNDIYFIEPQNDQVWLWGHRD
jgi:hypothetical protein